MRPQRDYDSYELDYGRTLTISLCSIAHPTRDITCSIMLSPITARECCTNGLAQLDITHVDWVKGDEVHLGNIWLAVFCEIFLLTENVDYFCHKVVTGFALVNLLLDAAFQGHREYVEYRSVHVRSLL